MRRVSVLSSWAVAMWSISTSVASAQAEPIPSLNILPIEEETRLALSAAPAHLREEAGVIALTASGFITVRASRNGFTCVVNGDHPLNRKPTCYDAEGARTILPKVQFVGELILAEGPHGFIIVVVGEPTP